MRDVLTPNHRLMLQDFMVSALSKARGGDLEGARSTVSAFFTGFERRVAADPAPEINVFFYLSLVRK
jgi:hypothetical protein